MDEVVDDSMRPHSFAAYCHGCDMPHLINVDNSISPYWIWNGNRLKPTFQPSLLVTYIQFNEKFICHSYIRDGYWHYLDDCTHKLAGQVVAMLPDPWRHCDV